MGSQARRGEAPRVRHPCPPRLPLLLACYCTTTTNSKYSVLQMTDRDGSVMRFCLFSQSHAAVHTVPWHTKLVTVTRSMQHDPVTSHNNANCFHRTEHAALAVTVRGQSRLHGHDDSTNVAEPAQCNMRIRSTSTLYYTEHVYNSHQAEGRGSDRIGPAS